MKSNLKLLSLSLVSLLFCLASASAQDEPQVSMKINLVAWGNDITGLSLEKPSGDNTTAESFAYNETLKYAGPQLLAIYQQDVKQKKPDFSEEDADDPGMIRPPEPEKKEERIDITKAKDPITKLLLKRKIEEPKLVCLVKLPTNTKHVTILLAPATQRTFQPYVIDDNPRDLPAGALRVHNLSRYPVRVEQLNGPQKKQLKPKGNFLFGPDKRSRFRYEISYEKGNDVWEAATNNEVRLPKNQKTQLVVLQSNNDFFLSSDGTKSGFLQVVVLKRTDDA